jgi:hypothetical protein
MVAAGVASAIMNNASGFWGFFKGFAGFQETGHIPGGVGGGGMLANVHAGEYILDEARVNALRAGYGVKGGKGDFAYEIPPAPAPIVEVHNHPGVDIETTTALRARAGEAKLAGRQA